MIRSQRVPSSCGLRLTSTWTALIVLNLGAGVVLIPSELQRGISTGALTVTPQLLSLTLLQWAVALGLVLVILIVRWLFLTGALMLFGVFVAANDSFNETAPLVALSLLPLAVEEALCAFLIRSGWFPAASRIILDVSILWPNAPSWVQSVFNLTDPFQIWGLWILAQGLLRAGVYHRAKYAWGISALAVGLSLVMGRVLLPG